MRRERSREESTRKVGASQGPPVQDLQIRRFGREREGRSETRRDVAHRRGAAERDASDAEAMQVKFHALLLLLAEIPAPRANPFSVRPAVVSSVRGAGPSRRTCAEASTGY